MASCITCGSYYRNSYYNKTPFCDSCLDENFEVEATEAADCRLEASLLQNPSGKTQPVFYEDRDHDDSFGF